MVRSDDGCLAAARAAGATAHSISANSAVLFMTSPGSPDAKARALQRCRQAMTAAIPLRYNLRMPDHSDQPSNWRLRSAPTLADIEAMAQNALARLPGNFRTLCEGVVIQVDDYAAEEVLDDMGIDNELDLMGLFQGIGLPFRGESVSGQMPNMIWLYRIPMLVYWAEHEETLGAVITHVLVHEIGHHFGLSDEDIEAIEAAAE
jgi:predicted Zn-dependent protease with MMP-like domain